MYQGKFDSKKKKSSVDTSQLISQRNASPRDPQKNASPRDPQKNASPRDPQRKPQNAPSRASAGSQSNEARQPAVSQRQAPIQQQTQKEGPRLGGVIFYTLYFMFILAFFATTFFGLQWLHGWLSSYEAAQPTVKAQQVFDQLFSDPDWGALYDAAGVEDTAFEGRDQFVSYMESTVDPSLLTYKETSAGLSEDKKYLVELDGEKIAVFTLCSDNQNAGLTDIVNWELSQVELYFQREGTYYIKNLDGHTVTVNGVTLDDSYTIQIATTVAAENYLPMGVSVSGLKTCTQQITGLMTLPTVTITDGQGNPMEVSYDEATRTFTEQTEANTISEEEKTVALKAAETYCLFMIERAGRVDIAQYFDTSSEVYSVITNLGDLWMQSNSGYRFMNETVTEYARYTDDLFSAKVSLALNVTRTDGTTRDFDFSQTLFFQKQNTGKWLAYDMTNVDVSRPVGQVRLTFMDGDTELLSQFYDTDTTEMTIPVVTAPEGKIFSGWYQIEETDTGLSYTMVFDPDDSGNVKIPSGTTLEPMTLYALFEDPATDTVVSETTEGA